MEFGYTPGDLYAGYVVDDSDLEFSDCSGGESSGDDRDGCSGRDYTKISSTGCPRNDSGSESEDEFEREMDKELMSKIELMVSPNVAKATNISQKSEVGEGSKSSNSAAGESSKQCPADNPSQEAKEYYDDIYFDSSDSGGEDEATNKGPGDGNIRNIGKKVCKLSNDELFYDPGMDADDERWVNRQRMAYHNVKVSRSLEEQKRSRGTWKKPETIDDSSSQDEVLLSGETGRDESKEAVSSKAEPPLPKSDAVLNCPACMTTLSFDCQRHDQYVNQYRAMFVLNCLVVREETLAYKPKPDKRSRKRRRKRGKNEMEEVPEEPVSYHPVRCRECNTEVAVYDQDEVFHFFNVLASAPT